MLAVNSCALFSSRETGTPLTSIYSKIMKWVHKVHISFCKAAFFSPVIREMGRSLSPCCTYGI
jgi:hypothetical protein